MCLGAVIRGLVFGCRGAGGGRGLFEEGVDAEGSGGAGFVEEGYYVEGFMLNGETWVSYCTILTILLIEQRGMD